jgi:hypothetical protein
MLCTRLNNCHWMFTFFLSRTVNRSIPLFLKLPKTGSTICHPFVVNKPATQRVEFALHPYSHASNVVVATLVSCPKGDRTVFHPTARSALPIC